MTQNILFDSLVPMPLLICLVVLTVSALIFALWRGLIGWGLRALAMGCLLVALAGPVVQQADQAVLKDIVLVVEDKTSSNRLGQRPDQMSAAREQLETALKARRNTDVRWVSLRDRDNKGGTQLMSAIRDALSDEPQARVAGVIALTDGQIHDSDQTPNFPAPFHVLLTGTSQDWDRKLIIRNAPSFAIIGEPVTLSLRIEDDGPDQRNRAFADLEIAIDGGEPQRFSIPVGRDFELPLTLSHGGRNVIEFTTPEADGELTARNNKVLIQMNGIRDRLRVLLVSGEPHPGARTWRNLLKSDSSVDLVHFTILRPPEKQDGVPVDELSLIAFPARELFMEKIQDFDLIIFDRYKRRGILPSLYLDNVANYVRSGGAVLVAAGPDFATAASIYRTPLAEILPARPSARVIEQAYRPIISNIGEKHPVTADLTGSKDWGRWLRQVEVIPNEGDVLMTGIDDRPLLILDRVDEGRVAMLASDNAWLWARGYEGGGPQLELLRRLSHWMMKEPDLEEDMLSAEATGQTIHVQRRSLGQDVGKLAVTYPDGQKETLDLEATGPGLWETRFEGPMLGLYRLSQGEKSAVIGLGPRSPKEFMSVLATDEIVRPIVGEQRGGILRLSEGIPKLRNVRDGRPAAGDNWIGLYQRSAQETLSVSRRPFLPMWLILLLSSVFLIFAWLRESI